MKSLSELQDQYYEEFRGLPGNCPIVRNNQPNDAFELVVLYVLYGKLLPSFTKDNALTFSNYVIAPPDNGIDIFFQHENGDESSFDVIQVKNTDLDESQLRLCIANMERTIEDYCRDPRSINSDSCKTILSNSNLDKTNKNKCTYYVIHTGTVDDFSSSKENEKIITLRALDIIYKNISEYVDRDELSIKESTKYGNPEDNSGAVVCSINGYDLAKLCNTYYSTEVGRNILFGSNLRESLINKNNKTFKSMSNTILDCPENFWYYNNGITIIARDIIEKEEGKIEIKEFSIVNGAQTTSALGLFLREATKNNEISKIDKLRKVFILTRVLKVSDEQMRQDIAIFNNTQNPITSRDMVANRPEQKHLNEWLLDDSYAQIYCEIRRGSQKPANFNKYFAHRQTNNEELAQLAYAAFYQKPFTAKDRKSALFNNDYTQTEFTINKKYHDVFNRDENNPDDNGVIFKKTKKDIDEVLFVKQLYLEAKKIMRSALKEKISRAQDQKERATSADQIKTCDERITINALHYDTVGICMFYFITLYYEFKAQFSGDDGKSYRFDQYYSDKTFRQNLIESATNLFLTYTVKILVKTAAENGKQGNLNNWVRSPKCEETFLRTLRDDIASDFDIETRYRDFCERFMA